MALAGLRDDSLHTSGNIGYFIASLSLLIAYSFIRYSILQQIHSLFQGGVFTERDLISSTVYSRI
jgi:uncharacterized membrane protein